jgi:hypothetical protein
MLFGIAVPATAAIISAPVVQTITSSADIALVLNTGTYVSAKNQGNANIDATINGVLFKKMTSGFNYEGGTNVPGTIRYISGAGAASGLYLSTNPGYVAQFAGVLNSTDYFATTVANEAIVGLDPLKTYRVQMLAGDNRTVTNSTLNYAVRAGTFTGAGPGIYTPIAGDIATFGATGVGAGPGADKTGFIATFTFTGYSAIDIRGTTPQGYISGISVFDITAIPEPSSVALMTVGGIGGLCWLRRKRST